MSVPCYRRRTPAVEAMRVPRELSDGDRDFKSWGALAFWLGYADWRVSMALGVSVRCGDGEWRTADPGDWIVREADGLSVIPDDDFRRDFESCQKLEVR